ncbi:MAG: polysaccharide biosynthesis protein [Bacteroidia bacterium]|nr:polysaccharide biosynthesis protein [Bacteroidia bacterium]MBT8309167.1 polysaccharide biosynthesis protein [Bacteroidia bacterium]NND11453.1 polysaccharide biosynthesis protein [Flavobacteriaceae bacterium]NNE15441.1 polysaccharide biosynthesis protein [Saprospiraceae bacterium]NNL60761.1 polysaccharide biosynthesis protein [Flavobacteriaceae bacterium]
MYRKILVKLFNRYASRWLILALDIGVTIFTFFFAYIIRFNIKLEFDLLVFAKQTPIIALLALISFLLLGTYKGVVRFTGIKDITDTVISVNVLATLLFVVTFIGRKFDFGEVFEIAPGVIYIHLLLNIFFLTGFKFFIKFLYREISSDSELVSLVLIYGAGDSGRITYEAISQDARSNMKVVGFIDDDEKKVGKTIDRLNVYPPSKITKQFIDKNNIDEVIISIQKISPKRLLELSSSFFSHSLNVKIVPPVKNWIDGDLSIGQIKNVKIEDLLGREEINITNPVLIDEYENQVIFVTGGAGSIGSEIARKLCNYKFKKLVLIDNAESALYDLQQEFRQKEIENFHVVVADVRNKVRIDQIFSEFKPKIVFHAAAYKHVPLMENSPHEAVSVNISGTVNITDLSIKHGVNKFVMVSTDKAVNPTNVMGASKRIAELYISCKKNKGTTRFITTRFGNVLGSNGSVIPLFKKQIENGGPLTVTHKEITRYFMTIPEACSLVLEAAAMGNGGEIFVFDMGEPVNIFELAVNMIKLSGLNYPEDIDIKITGLRPGEKIYEELLADGENTKPTYHEKIMIAKTKKIDLEVIEGKIQELCNTNLKCQNLDVVAKIKDIVPEYVSNNSKFEVLDK